MSSISEIAPVGAAATLGGDSVERYSRLNIVDRHAAETLNEFCKVNTPLGLIASSLANRAAVQSFFTAAPLALADFLSLYASIFIAGMAAEQSLTSALKPTEDQSAFFISLIVLPIAHLAGLYPGLGLGSVLEFRQLARTLFASLTVFAGIGWFCVPHAWLFYSFTAATAFVVALPVAATVRFFVRRLAQLCPWWGMRVLVVAEPKRAVELYRRLQQTQDQGFRPVGVLVDTQKFWRDDSADETRDVPVFDIRQTDEVANRLGVTWVIVSACANRSVSPTLDRALAVIPNRVLLSSAQLDLGLWDQQICVGSTTGLQMGGSKPTLIQLAFKRLLDVTLTCVAFIAGLPVIATLCFLVRLSSRGPMFYSQKRIGKGGRLFSAWKFRTMHANAHEVLDQYLATHPEAQREWDEKHKLTDDPRVTRIGKFLRGTSLDELPQLWNVLLGDMSLVGPRPIINSPTYDAEYVENYPHEFEAYKSVRPGLTGMWQVRCRNSGVYELRIYWDMYYIRNWCIWLDLYLIMRTIKTVLLREGAY